MLRETRSDACGCFKQSQWDPWIHGREAKGESVQGEGKKERDTGRVIKPERERVQADEGREYVGGREKKERGREKRERGRESSRPVPTPSYGISTLFQNSAWALRSSCDTGPRGGHQS